MTLIRYLSGYKIPVAVTVVAFCCGQLPAPVWAEAEATAGPCGESEPIDILETMGVGEKTLATEAPIQSLADEIVRRVGPVGRIFVDLRFDPKPDTAEDTSHRGVAVRMIACPDDVGPAQEIKHDITTPETIPVEDATDATQDTPAETESDASGLDGVDPSGESGIALKKSLRPQIRPSLPQADVDEAVEEALTGDADISNVALDAIGADIAAFIAEADRAVFYRVAPRPERDVLALGPYVVVSQGTEPEPLELAKFKRLILETPGAFLSLDTQKSCPSSPEFLVELTGGGKDGVVDVVISMSCGAIGFIHNKSTPAPKQIFYYDPILPQLQSLLASIAR